MFLQQVWKSPLFPIHFCCDKQPTNPKWLHAVHVVEDTCHLASYMCFFFKRVKMKHGQIRFHSWTVFLFSLLEMVLTWVDCTAFSNWVAGWVLKHLNQSSIPIGGLFSCNRFGNCSCFWSRFVIRSFSLNPRGLLRSPNVKKVRANIGLHVLQYYRHRLCPRDLTNCNDMFFRLYCVYVLCHVSPCFFLFAPHERYEQ